jgi:hypothetical protein
MADESKTLDSIRFVRNRTFDPVHKSLTWTFGTLIFDEDRKLREIKIDPIPQSITVDAKTAPITCEMRHQVDPSPIRLELERPPQAMPGGLTARFVRA